jgi:SMC interacting uncharacterized protein involved in chromosome segregation
LTDQRRDLHQEIETQKLKESPIVAVEQQRDRLEKERQHWLDISSQQAYELKNINTIIRELHDEASTLDAGKVHLQAQTRELDLRLESQEISRSEAERMATEKEKIMTEISATEQRIRDSSQIMWEKEIDLQKRLHDAETVFSEYRDLAKDLGLIPSSGSAFARAQGVDFELDLNVHSSDPQGMSAAPKRERVRPALSALRGDLLEKLRSIKNDQVNLYERKETASDTLTEMRHAFETMELTLSRLNEELRSRKLRYERELIDLTTEANEIEVATKNARDTAETNRMVWANKRQKAQIEYDKTVSEHREKSEQIHEDIVHILDYMIQVKGHIETSLDSLDEEIRTVQHVSNQSLELEPILDDMTQPIDSQLH